MNANLPPIDLATAALLVIAAVVLLSILRLFMFWFGGGDPLVWNTVSRVEAAQNPANLLNSWQEHQNRRRAGCLMGMFVLVAIFMLLAPEESAILAQALLASAVKIVSAAWDSVQVFLERYRSG